MVSWLGHDRDAARRLRLGLGAAAMCMCGLLAACGAKTGLRVPDAGVEPEPPEPDIPCIDVPVEDELVTVDLDTDAEIRRADVFFLIDNTQSMKNEIDAIRAQLRNTLAPAIYEEIPDTEFGVATFSDFPVGDYGRSDDMVEDHPFDLRLQMTEDLARVQGAVDVIRLGDGVDTPESQVEALYQVATGEGLEPYIQPSFGCPGGGFGAACFRDDAQPVVLLFTDDEFHGGPVSGAQPYDPAVLGVAPHTYEATVEELTRRGIRVLGLWSGEMPSKRVDLEAVAEDTGAVDVDGRPLVFDIGRDGERLGTGVVDTLKEFADAVVYDIDAIPEDPEPGDGVDATTFVKDIRPVRAEPMSAIEGIDETKGVFRGVQAGTRVFFELLLGPQGVERGPEPQRFRLLIRFRGDGSTFLGSTEVELVVPALGGEACGSLSDDAQ